MRTTFAETKFFDVPWSHQEQAWGCGQNSVRMILGYWGDRVELARLVLYTGPRGTHAKMWKDIFSKHFPDYELSDLPKSFAGVKAAIDKGEPILAAVNAGELTYLDYAQAAGHFIVLVGYDDEKKVVYLRDPNSEYVEELAFATLEKAWAGDGYESVSIRKKGKAPVADAKPFSDKAKARGASKEKGTGLNVLALLPAVHLAQWSRADSDLSRAIGRSSLADTHFNARLGGISFGHTAVVTSPFLAAHSSLALGASLGFDFGRGKIIFSQGPSLASDTLPLHRERVFDAQDFSSTRRIPGQGTSRFKLDFSGFVNTAISPWEQPSLGNGLTLTNAFGGRLGGRIGITPAFGEVRFGVSVDQLGLSGTGVQSSATSYSGDFQIGPWFGALSGFKRDADAANSRAVGTAWSAGLDLHLPTGGMSGTGIFALTSFFYNVANVIGIPKTFVRVDSEVWSLGEVNARESRIFRWEAQSPIDLVFLKLIWGFRQSYEDSVNVLIAAPRTEVGFTAVLNPFMPWFQLQVGYRYGWKLRDADHMIFLGVFVGNGS